MSADGLVPTGTAGSPQPGRRAVFGRLVETSQPAIPSRRPSSLAPSDKPAPAGSSLGQVRSLCLSRIDPSAVANTPAGRLAEEIERLVGEAAAELRLQINAREQRQLALELVDDMLGLGPLEPLLDDDTVTDIMVNGPDRIYVERRGKLTLSGLRFRDAQHVMNIAQRIAAGVGRRVDEASPMVDARLADGSRVNIIFPPIALDGPCISIRKFARQRIDLARLVELGSLSPAIARLLDIAGRARLNMLISGGTGTGKTTLLNAISEVIDPGERIVTIEDAAELQLLQPHVVRLETRPSNVEGRGEVTQRDLVRNALRMRPDRIIVGECRGQEAFDMLQAMNTGHDGSMTTIHANSARDALTRIENMVQMGNFGLPLRAIRTQIVSALDLVVHLERHRDGCRRVVQVCDVIGIEGDVIALNELVRWEPTPLSDGRVGGHWQLQPVQPSFQTRLAYSGLERAWAGLFVAETST